MKNEPYLKSIKIFENITKLTINKFFFKKHKLTTTPPLTDTTKHQLKNLIQLNEQTKNWALNAHLEIETLETSTDYVDVFFSKQNSIQTATSNQHTSNEIAIVAKFNKLRSLKFFCTNIFQTYKPFWITSELYKFKKIAFILIVHTKKETENEFSALLTEFNASTEKGKFQEAIAKEHCQMILASNAIEKISLIN